MAMLNNQRVIFHRPWFSAWRFPSTSPAKIETTRSRWQGTWLSSEKQTWHFFFGHPAQRFSAGGHFKHFPKRFGAFLMSP